MNCKNCNTENANNAIFCNHCGKRLDGSADEQTNSTWEKVKSGFDLGGSICAIVAVFFSFVFTFFIGVSLYVEVLPGFSSLSESSMIWEYFGSAYKDLKTTLDSMESYSSYLSISMYLPVIFGTLISVATLIASLTFTVVASVKFAMHFKNGENGYGKCATAAVLSYVLGSLLIYAATACSVSSTAFVKPSNATMAGIVLSCTFLGLYFACKVVTLGKSLLQKKTIVNFVCTLAGIATAVIAVTFASKYVYNIVITASSGYESEKTSVGMNPFFVNAMLSTIYDESAYTAGFAGLYIVNILSQLAQLTVLILGAVLLIKRIALFGERQDSLFAISVAFVSVATVSLILTCVGMKLSGDYLNGLYLQNLPDGASSGTKIVLTASSVLAFLASLLQLAASIVHKVLCENTQVQNDCPLPAPTEFKKQEKVVREEAASSQNPFPYDD